MIIFTKPSVQRLLPFLALSFLVSIFSLGLAPVRCQAQPAIFAGEGMGQIHIGETRASVLKKLGKPTKSLRWDTVAIQQDTWTSKKSNSRLVVLYIVKGQQVVQVETTSPKFYTPTGLSVESNAAEAGAFLGQGKGGMLFKTTGSLSPRYYFMMHNVQKGIAFFFNVTQGAMHHSKCEKIMVFSSLLPLPFVSQSVYKPIKYEEYLRYKRGGG